MYELILCLEFAPNNGKKEKVQVIPRTSLAMVCNS